MSRRQYKLFQQQHFNFIYSHYRYSIHAFHVTVAKSQLRLNFQLHKRNFFFTKLLYSNRNDGQRQDFKAESFLIHWAVLTSKNMFNDNGDKTRDPYSKLVGMNSSACMFIFPKSQRLYRFETTFLWGYSCPQNMFL